jgi:hypothetical protein
MQFFLPGLSRVRPKGALRIYNKVGRAYGFTVENSWVSYFLTLDAKKITGKRLFSTIVQSGWKNLAALMSLFWWVVTNDHLLAVHVVFNRRGSWEQNEACRSSWQLELILSKLWLTSNLRETLFFETLFFLPDSPSFKDFDRKMV